MFVEMMMEIVQERAWLQCSLERERGDVSPRGRLDARSRQAHWICESGRDIYKLVQ